MLKRKYLYDFGLSQDDPGSELRVLDLSERDRVLCIASAGEVPLDFLVTSPESVTIDAVDIATSQIYLSNIKLQSALQLDGYDAAAFLGYLPATRSNREKWFERIKKRLTEAEVTFWERHPAILKQGPIRLGRYETYISLFAPLGRLLLGGKARMLGLFDCSTVAEQKNYFDHNLRSDFLKALFKIMFSKRLYRSGGIPEEGLIHMSRENLGLKFYCQFRDFCTNTAARDNWMLQFVLFDRVLFEQALPAFLQPDSRSLLRGYRDRLSFIKESYTGIIKKRENSYYNKFALSNISDWLSVSDFKKLLELISKKGQRGSRGLIRYIHSAEIEDPDILELIDFEPKWGTELLQKDRFPFYKLIPFHLKTGRDA